MTACELLAQLEADDIRLTIKGDRLVLNAPQGVLSPERLEKLRPYKQELMAIIRERQSQSLPKPQPERDSFDDIVEDARRFQGEGKAGPWEAFTMGAEALEGAIGGLSREIRGEFDLRIDAYRQDGLPDDQARRIAIFLLTGENRLPLGEPLPGFVVAPGPTRCRPSRGPGAARSGFDDSVLQVAR